MSWGGPGTGRRDPDPSPRQPTGWAQALKQQRTSRPTPTSISATRWRRLLGSHIPPTARSPGPTLRGLGEALPSGGRRRAFERRAWRGEKNGGHSNAAEGRQDLRGSEKAGLRGRKLAHPQAFEPRRCRTWGNSSDPDGRDLTSHRQRRTKAIMGPEGEQKEPSR